MSARAAPTGSVRSRSNPNSRNAFLPRNKAQGGYYRCVRAQIPPSPKSATPRSPGPFAKRPPLPPPPPSALPVRAPVADTYPLEYRRMWLVHPLPGGGPVSKAHGGYREEGREETRRPSLSIDFSPLFMENNAGSSVIWPDNGVRPAWRNPINNRDAGRIPAGKSRPAASPSIQGLSFSGLVMCHSRTRYNLCMYYLNYCDVCISVA